MKKILLFIFLLPVLQGYSQSSITDKRIITEKWQAFWIQPSDAPPTAFGVYEFRKTVSLSNVPAQFIVHVSADNRYKLYVNGQLVSLGPARGDVYHWYYETVDISPYLKAGQNELTATVWNFAEWKPEAQISLQTAFILQGNTAAEDIVNTDDSWEARTNPSYKPLQPDLIYTYYVAGPGEDIDMNLDSGNQSQNVKWKKAVKMFNGLPKGVFDWSTGWMLVPRPIPPMELTEQRLAKLRTAEGITAPSGFPAQKQALTVPAGAKVKILLDQGHLTNAYPVLQFSGGKDAVIQLSYAEALYIDEGNQKNWKAQNQKGHRDSFEGKRFVGVKDRIRSNGSGNQQFTSLWWRTYRYLLVEIETAGQPLRIEDVYGLYTGYPFKMNAQFEASDKSLNQILETGWRTARLCAVETYMDCPYYEQLQYIGDTRIQALVSLFNSGDDSLVKHAITSLDYSRMAEGITLSRYPTAHAQEIPTFSLWWIGMLHDYHRYGGDTSFVRQFLPGMRQVLSFFKRYQGPDGSLQRPPYWNFTDWTETKGWSHGVAPNGMTGNSAALDVQLLWAYQLASELEKQLGEPDNGTQYAKEATAIKATMKSKYWNQEKGCFADIPEKNLFSQHTNTLAILTGLVSGGDASRLARQLISDTSFAPATIYFKYYLHQALAKAGLGDLYLDMLGDWRRNLELGMTTWAEISEIERARSDCHAWGSSPNIELFRIVLGIDSDGPGFRKIRIKPHPGKLTEVSGSIPHPNGKLSCSLKNENGKWTIVTDLPQGTTGVLIWKGKEMRLKAGKMEFGNL